MDPPPLSPVGPPLSKGLGRNRVPQWGTQRNGQFYGGLLSVLLLSEATERGQGEEQVTGNKSVASKKWNRIKRAG